MGAYTAGHRRENTPAALWLVFTLTPSIPNMTMAVVIKDIDSSQWINLELVRQGDMFVTFMTPCSRPQ